MRALTVPVLLLLLSMLAACGGGGSGGDAAAVADGAGGVDARSGDGGGAGGDAGAPGTTQRTCAFRLRFTETTTALDGECRAYTPVSGRFRTIAAGPCVFTADSSLGEGTTVVEGTGRLTAIGAALPGTPVVATADPNAHYSRTEAAVIAGVGETIVVSSTGAAVPAIADVTVTRPPDVVFDELPGSTISQAAGWTVAHQTADAGQLRIVISQNMGNVFKKAVCTEDATAPSLVVPAAIMAEFFIGTAFAAFEAVDVAQATAGAYGVEVSATAAVEQAAAPLTGMSVSVAD